MRSHESSGTSEATRVAVVNLGGLALIEGDYARAREFSELGLRLHREQDSRDGEAISLLNLGFAALEEGAVDEAKQHLEQSRDSFVSSASPSTSSFALEGLAGVAAAGAPSRGGSTPRARRGATGRAGRVAWPVRARLHEKTLATVREHLDAEVLTEAWDEGRARAGKSGESATR